jgi:hypothetical protein
VFACGIRNAAVIDWQLDIKRGSFSDDEPAESLLLSFSEVSWTFGGVDFGSGAPTAELTVHT